MSDEQILSDEHLDWEVTVKVDGKEEKKPLKDVIAGYQKDQASQERFRKAKELEMEFEQDIAIAKDFKEGWKNRDISQLRRAFRNAGMTDDEIDAAFASKQQQQSQYQNDDDDDDDDDEEAIMLKRQIMEMRQEIASLKNDQEAGKRKSKQQEVREQVDRSVDADKELASIMRKYSDDEATTTWLRRQIYDAVAKASERLPWGPRAIESGLSDAKKTFDKVGIGKSATPGAEERAPTAGLGPSGHSVGQLHQPLGKKRKDVKVNDPDFARAIFEDITERMSSQE